MPTITTRRRRTAQFALVTVVMCVFALQAQGAAARQLEVPGGGRPRSEGDEREGGGLRARAVVPRLFPYGYRHRGDYAVGSKVYATTRVGCIWAKVTYGYPAGSISVGPGGPSGSVSGGEYEGNGFYVNCRQAGHTHPTRLSLYGVGYAKGLLNSTTLQVCTSRPRPRGRCSAPGRRTPIEGQAAGARTSGSSASAREAPPRRRSARRRTDRRRRGR